MTCFQPEIHLYPKTIKFSEVLRKCKSFFIGETGPIGINSIAVNEKTFKREEKRLKKMWNKVVDSTGVHQNDGYFTAWRNTAKEACLEYFGRDFSYEEWNDYVLAVNVICAEVFKGVIEYSRVSRWSKTGVIWWSLMDMWPMLFNYSVMDYEYNRKLAYYWIRQSQQEFALMGVRKEIDWELSICAANDTLFSQVAEYSITAYDEKGNGRIIATGICEQGPNSSELIQRIAEPKNPELWIIKWNNKGSKYTNHVFTGRAPFETVKLWVKMIGDECFFDDEILEIL